MIKVDLISFKEKSGILKKTWNLFVCLFSNAIGHLLLKFHLRKNLTYKYHTAICAIFKDESPFLKEWIKYHFLMGVQHIYLINNGSTDNFRKELGTFIKLNQITLIEWPKPNSQFEAYEHWYRSYSHETKWFSFIDIDEFICPIYDTDINNFLKKYQRYPSVLIYWKMFGTGGQEFHDPNKLVIEQYTNAWENLYDFGKVFIQSEFPIYRFDSGVHHSPRVKVKILGFELIFPVVNEFKFFVIRDIHLKLPFTKSHIRINHYWSKALDIYKSKMNKTDVAFEKNPKSNWDYFFRHETNNITSDFTIYRFLIRLKNSMKTD